MVILCPHFLLIKKNWKKFLENNEIYLNYPIKILYRNNLNVLEKLSDILDICVFLRSPFISVIIKLLSNLFIVRLKD